MEEGKLRIYRPKQKADKLCDYTLSVDGEDRGSVEAGEFFIAMLPVGMHTAQAHIDSCSSPLLEVRIEAGKTCDCEVGNAGKLMLLVRLLTNPESYLYLRPGICRDM